MSSELAQHAPGSPRALPTSWPVWLGFLVLGIPTLIGVGEEVWSQEYGAHGPILLAAGGWLLWRERPNLMRNGRRGAVLLTALIAAVALPLYVFGRAYDFISLEVGGLYLFFLAVLHDMFGVAALRRCWFPLLYLAFLIPPPIWLLDSVTAPLKHLVSQVSAEGLYLAGYPVQREGVILFVAQYQLLVEDACSGMNSLIGLIAISLLYIYLMHGSRLLYSMALVAFVIPIAIIANVARICVLVLLTYYFGDEVAQGFAHFMAGIFLFSVALLMVFMVDKLLARIWIRERAA